MTDQQPCRWDRATKTRLLLTHQPDCESAACLGCQPCPERHCQVCKRQHVTLVGRGTDQTCATCLEETP